MSSNRPASSHDTAAWFEQDGFGVRFGWGPSALRRLAPRADAVIIVDVLSFSTCVDIALGRGAVVLPYKWHDGTEHHYGEQQGAVVARRVDQAEEGEWTLSPSRLAQIPSGTRLVLPSPNGSALTFGAREAGAERVQVACFRNASAVAASNEGADVVAVIAAGERWRGATGPLRPAVEDLLGAGAIIAALGTQGASPEARAAAAAFVEAAPHLEERLLESGSGRELLDRGLGPNVALAAARDASPVVPTLTGVELTDL